MMTKKLPAWGLSRGILCYLEVVSGENQRRLGKLSGVTIMGHSWISYFVNTAAVCLLVIIFTAAFRERKDRGLHHPLRQNSMINHISF